VEEQLMIKHQPLVTVAHLLEVEEVVVVVLALEVMFTALGEEEPLEE